MIKKYSFIISMTNRFEDNGKKTDNKTANNTKNKNNKTIKNKKFKPNIIKKEMDFTEFFDIIDNQNKDNKDNKDNIKIVKLKQNILDNPLNKIDNFKELLNLSNLAKNKENETIQYILPIQRLSKINDALKELDNVIGLDDIKDDLVDQIIYLVSHCDEKDPPMLHTIIDGPPGTGKTKIARIIGKIISKIDYLKPIKPKSDEKQNFTSIAKLIKDSLVIDIVPEKKEQKKESIVKYVTRGDLVGGYLGQTALKTQKAIDEASGGVLIIDEAYSLGGKRGSEDTDSYSQECIDTLVSNLSENRSFVCIILGYTEEIKNSFISKNKGLESRFPFKYSIKKYDIGDLLNILKNKIISDGYTFKDDIFKEFNQKDSKDFKFLGRDMEVLWFNIKMAHTRRQFISNNINDKEIILEDINKGLKKFFNNRPKVEKDMSFLRMYT